MVPNPMVIMEKVEIMVGIGIGIKRVVGVITKVVIVLTTATTTDKLILILGACLLALYLVIQLFHRLILLVPICSALTLSLQALTNSKGF